MPGLFECFLCSQSVLAQESRGVTNVDAESVWAPQFVGNAVGDELGSMTSRAMGVVF